MPTSGTWRPYYSVLITVSTRSVDEIRNWILSNEGSRLMNTGLWYHGDLLRCSDGKAPSATFCPYCVSVAILITLLRTVEWCEQL